jgi:DNA-binding NtrC family response regulator
MLALYPLPAAAKLTIVCFSCESTSSAIAVTSISSKLKSTLLRFFCKASAFYNAESALEGVEAGCPELVISDVMMPGMNGVDMAVVVKERHPDCKVLLFSGNAAMVDMLTSARRQGHDFELLSKPVHPADLLAKIACDGMTSGTRS